MKTKLTLAAAIFASVMGSAALWFITSSGASAEAAPQAGKQPGLRIALGRLSAATGLRFTLADNLAHHNPDLGDVDGLGEIPAYSLMEIIAECDIDNGRWEKSDGGYHLTGISRTPLPPGRFRWWWGALPLAIALAASVAFVVQHHRKKICMDRDMKSPS